MTHQILKQMATYKRQAAEYEKQGDYIRASVCEEHGTDMLELADIIRLL